jgi:soluble lytic murein transglycosylase-like protein
MNYKRNKLILLFVAMMFDFMIVSPFLTWDHLLEANEYMKYYSWMTTEKFTAIYNAHKCYDVPIDEICAIINSESKGIPTAKSYVNARGLMQILPRYHYKNGNPDDLYKIQLNIMKGTEIWKECKQIANGNVKKALVYYNAGPFCNVKKYKNWKYIFAIMSNELNTRILTNKIVYN